jgi:hypothetical protein
MCKEAVISKSTLPSQDYNKITQSLDVVGLRVEVQPRGFLNNVLEYNALYRQLRREDVNWIELADDEA